MWTIPQRLVALIVLLALTFGAGWYTKSRFAAAGEVKQTRAALKESAQEVTRSAQVSQTVETAISQDLDRVQSIKVAVAKRIATNTPIRHDQYTRPPTAEEPGAIFVRDDRVHLPVLDAGTVRLLNAARTGASVEPSPGGAAKE